MIYFFYDILSLGSWGLLSIFISLFLLWFFFRTEKIYLLTLSFSVYSLQLIYLTIPSFCGYYYDGLAAWVFHLIRAVGGSFFQIECTLLFFISLSVTMKKFRNFILLVFLAILYLEIGRSVFRILYTGDILTG